MKMFVSLIALAIASPATAETLAITNAEAWTMETDQPVRGATILIEDGRIVSVAEAGPVPWARLGTR